MLKHNKARERECVYNIMVEVHCWKLSSLRAGGTFVLLGNCPPSV